MKVIDCELQPHQEFAIIQAKQVLEQASREELIATCLTLLDLKFRLDNVVKSLVCIVVANGL